MNFTVVKATVEFLKELKAPLLSKRFAEVQESPVRWVQLDEI